MNDISHFTDSSLDASDARPTNGGDLQSLRGQNRLGVLTAVRNAQDGASLTELQAVTGLSRPTIHDLITELGALGLVTELDERTMTSRGGRPGRRFGIAWSGLGLLGGATIGLRRVEVRLADLRGREVAARTIPTTSEDADHARLIRDALVDLLGELHLPATAVRALTVGVLGIVSPTGELRQHPGRRQLSEPGAFAPLSEAFGGRVALANDANLAALSSFAMLSRTGVTDMIGLHADVAVGCGIILGGRLHTGRNGAAGELGFLPALGWNDAHETLIAFADAHGIAIPEMFARAGSGEPEAVAVVAAFARTIAPGVISLILALDPPVMAVSGQICAAREAFVAPLREAIARTVPSAPEIVVSSTGGDSVIRGALAMSRNEAWRALIVLALAGESTSTEVF